jgi:hypothetical protein
VYACPWCERKSFSFWQKQSLGPNKPVKCKGCRRPVSVPWGRAHLAALPLMVLAVLGMYFVGDAFDSKLYAVGGALAGAILGMLFTIPLYHFFVPLVKPGSDTGASEARRRRI